MGTHPDPDHPMLGVEIVAPNKVQFPSITPELYGSVIKGDFSSLDNETQQLLVDACEQDMLYKFPPEIREVRFIDMNFFFKIYVKCKTLVNGL